MGVKNADNGVVAGVSGARGARNLRRNMLRPSVAQCSVLATHDLGHIVLHIAGLSFLGLGVKAPTPEWGVMISDGKEYLFSHPELIYYPGAAIFLCVMSFNIIGDYLRDKFGVHEEMGH